MRKFRGAPLDSGSARGRVAPSASLYFVTVRKSLLKKPSGQIALIRSTSASLDFSAEADRQSELIEGAEQNALTCRRVAE
jgi:hypothetical protein